jgi:sulfur-carrier protein
VTAEATGAAISIRIPPTLRAQAGGAKAVEVQATTVGGAIDALVERFPSLASVLRDGGGQLSRFINVYRNEDDIRHLDGTATALSDGDTVVLLPAMAGGSGNAPGA